MRHSLSSAAVAGLFAIAIAAAPSQAQAGHRQGSGDREARREWMKEHRSELKAKWESLTPEQRQAWKTYEQSYSAERKTLMEQVKAGTLDKKSAAEQLKAWRQANKPKQG